MNLTPDEYLAELNRRLQAHPLYEEGCEFTAAPSEPLPGATASKAAGCSWSGPVELTAVCLEVASRMAEEHSVK